MPTDIPNKSTIAIVGCGKVGTCLGKFLSDAGYPVAGVASRSMASAERTAGIIGIDRFSDRPETVTAAAGIVLITTPDDAIASTCQHIADKGGVCPGAVVLHCSGALPSTLLAPAKASGATIGSMHPLQSFARIEVEKNPFCGIVVSVEGEPAAVATARAMAQDLEAVCVEIRTEAKTLYHASAVVASNYLVTVMDLAFQLLESAGIDTCDVLKVLKPLIDGTLANIEKVGIPEALTGPIARGDVETVATHLDQIGSLRPDLLSLYRALGQATVGLARAKGLEANRAEQLSQLLDSAP
ncbi:MAG: DUF2520 domain-containing protein [Desulfobacterales bacterium]|nr:DUF2520 domain-containing protein [Desulfobacterales bacterium]